MNRSLPSLVTLLVAAAFALVTPADAARPVLTQDAKLTVSDAAVFDNFGWSVALDGGVAVVGAPGDDDNGTRSGSAYVYDTATGQELAKLTASDGAAGDWFGYSVAVDGGVAVVGAFFDDDNGTRSGSAYVYDTATGQELAKLTASDAAESDQFGFSVALDGGVAVVGAWGDRDNGSESGSAYVYDAATGQELAKLTASDGAAGDWFGFSVALDGGVAVVGAVLHDDNNFNSGSAYLFDTATGQELAKLTASDGAANDQFGWSVAIDGNLALVGAHRDDDNGPNSGSAYLFDVTTGEQLAKLVAGDGALGDVFGHSVALDGGLAIVGAYRDDNGSGSAYVFDVSAFLIPEPTGATLAAAALLAATSASARSRTSQRPA
ncbi:MAG: FG-GAP repeat protein [Planctomycetota bacterium]